VEEKGAKMNQPRHKTFYVDVGPSEGINVNTKELKNKNIPQESGTYLARTNSKYQWYRYIVEVTGESPMLKAKLVWDRLDDKLYSGFVDSETIYWGPKLKIPEVPQEEITR